METQQLKRCNDCREWKPLAFFHSSGTFQKKICNEFVAEKYRRPVCKDCEFKKRQIGKVEAKAANAIYNHAKKLGISPEEFMAGGVNKEYVAYLFQRELNLIKAFGIAYCVNCFPSKDQKRNPCYNENTALGELHLDIIDIVRFRRVGILTRSNVRVICRTANIAKGRKDSTTYDVEVLHYGQDEAAIQKGIQFNLPVNVGSQNYNPLQPNLL